MNKREQIYQLEKDWNENPRWEEVTRPYSAKDVVDYVDSTLPPSWTTYYKPEQVAL